jgi:hypothetical protein
MYPADHIVRERLVEQFAIICLLVCLDPLDSSMQGKRPDE